MPPLGMPGGEQRSQQKFIIFENFEKMNTQAARQGQKETELQWLENLQPIAANNYPTVPAPAAAALATIPGTVSVMYYAAIQSADYFIVFTTAGGGYAVNIATGAVAQFAAVGTFTTDPDVTTWQATRILIADPQAGYSTWDGTSFVAQGGISPNIVVTNGGSYATPPAVTISGGSGTGATGTAVLTNGTVTSVTLTNPGSGYKATDTPTLTFASATGSGATGHVTMTGVTINSIQITTNGQWVPGTPVGTYNLTFAGGTVVSGTPSGTVHLAHINGVPSNDLTIDAIAYTGNARFSSAPNIGVNAPGAVNNPVLTPIFNSDGTIATIVRDATGSGYVTPPPVSIVGGHGSATAVAVLGGGGGVASLSLTSNPGGYTLGEVPIVVVGQVSSATGTVHVWPFVPNPATLAVFQGRVWLGGGTTPQLLQWSGTGASYANVGYDDFLANDASGSLLISDADLIHQITALRSLNNYLFIVGDNAIKQIGSISLGGTNLDETLFTILTLSSDQGTVYRNSCISYNRVFLFCSPNGIYGVFGTSVQKLSSDLDGIFQNVVFTQPPQAALLDLNRIHNACFLLRYNDPTETLRSILVVFDGKKWWVASQGANLLSIVSAETLSTDLNNVYGSSGTDVTELFANPAGSVSIKLQTALTHHGNALQGKKIIRAGLTSNIGTASSVTIELDADAVTQTTNWSIPAYFALVGGTNDENSVPVNIGGIYLGMTITATLQGWTFTNAAIEYQETQLWKSSGAPQTFQGTRFVAEDGVTYYVTENS